MMCFPVPWICLVLGMSVPLSGTVEDASGKPVEGATVWLADPFRRDTTTEVLVESKTDAQGRFRLERPDDLVGRAPSWSPTLWAHKAGSRVAFVEFKQRVPGADEPVKLVLGPPNQTSMQILLPDGKPAPGARVRMTQSHIVAPRMPAGLLDRFATTTDDQGRAVLEGIAPEDVSWVEVTSPGFVTQTHAFDPLSPEEKTVTLRPVGRLAVKILSDDPNSVRGWKVTASSMSLEPGYRGPTTSWVRSTSDELGLAGFRPIAVGRIFWEVEPPQGSDYLAISPSSVIIKAGELTEVNIQVRKSVLVEGTVVEEPGGKPVPNAEVSLLPLQFSGSFKPQKTGDDGKFSFKMLPDKLRFTFREAPKTHYLPPGSPTWLDFDVKEGEERHVMAPFTLKVASVVRGKVLDSAGRPQPGVNVYGNWRSKEYGANGGSTHTTTDPQGEFVLGSIPPGADVNVAANVGMVASSTTARTIASDNATVTIELKKNPTLALSGRVIGPDGQPAANVPVRIRVRTRGQQFNQGGDFSFDGKAEVRTGPDGIFHTPDQLPAGNEYRCAVRGTGLEPVESNWISAPATTFPDLVLRRGHRLRVVRGRVSDTDGKPLADAFVYQSGDGPRITRGQTDAEGRFQVPGIPDFPAFLFFRKDGYRVLGRRVDPADKSVDFVVARTDQAPTFTLKVAPSALSRDQERAVARELIAPAWQRALAGGGDGSDRRELIPLMASIDPDRVAAMIENQAIEAEPDVLSNLALARLETSPRDAMDILESIGDAQSAASALLATFDQLGSNAIDVRRDLLDRALRRAREIVENGRKMAILAQVADRWFDLGDSERATPIVREAEGLLARISKGDFTNPRGSLADVLARIDLPGAMKLLEGQEENYGLDRQRASIAIKVASTNPVEAKKLLSLIQNPSEKHRARQSICLRMATTDLPAARTLAEETRDPTLSAVLPALAARKLASTNVKAARALMFESFDRLGRLAESGGSDSFTPPCLAMAQLLPLLNRIDPERAPGMFWYTVASRPPLATNPESRPVLPQTRQHFANLAELAALLSRYDRSVAEAIFGPVAERVPGMLDETWGLGNEGMAIFRAATIFDAARAKALLDVLPEDPPPADNRQPGGPRFVHKSKAQARMAIIRTLRLAPEFRSKELQSPITGHEWLAELDD